jgi:hypothetical protein
MILAHQIPPWPCDLRIQQHAEREVPGKLPAKISVLPKLTEIHADQLTYDLQRPYASAAVQACQPSTARFGDVAIHTF